MINKKLFFSSIVLAGTLALTGCGERPEDLETDGQGSGAPEGATEEPEADVDGSDLVGSEDADVTLRIMTWNNSPEAIREEARIFEEFYDETGIAVEMVHTSWEDYNERFMTMAAGGNAPDLMWIQPSGFAPFANNDLLMNIEDQMNDLDLDEFLPGVLELGQVEGTQYGLIRDRSSTFIAYNKDMFDEAGVDYPEPDWSHEDFIDISEQLTVMDGDRVVQFAHEDFFMKESLAVFGATLMDPETAAVTFDSPASLEAFQWRSDLINEYNVVPTGAQSEGLSNMFISETAAMRMAGPWNWIEFEENGDFNWDIVPLPQANEDAFQPANYLPIGISASTDHPDESWELLKFLGYGRGQDIQGDIVSAIPVVSRAVGDLLNFAGAPDGAQYLVDVLDAGDVQLDTPFHRSVPEIENRILNEVERINLSGEEVDEPLENLAEDIRRDFDLD